MRLQVGSNPEAEDPSESALENAFRALSGREADAFLVLSKDDDCYMQAARQSKERFVVEYRDESGHFRASNVPVSSAIALFRSYRAADDTWRTGAEWYDVTSEFAEAQPETTEPRPTATGSQVLWATAITVGMALLTIVLLAACVLFWPLAIVALFLLPAGWIGAAREWRKAKARS